MKKIIGSLLCLVMLLSTAQAQLLQVENYLMKPSGLKLDKVFGICNIYQIRVSCD